MANSIASSTPGMLEASSDPNESLNLTVGSSVAIMLNAVSCGLSAGEKRMSLVKHAAFNLDEVGGEFCTCSERNSYLRPTAIHLDAASTGQPAKVTHIITMRCTMCKDKEHIITIKIKST